MAATVERQRPSWLWIKRHSTGLAFSGLLGVGAVLATTGGVLLATNRSPRTAQAVGTATAVVSERASSQSTSNTYRYLVTVAFDTPAGRKYTFTHKDETSMTVDRAPKVGVTTYRLWYDPDHPEDALEEKKEELYRGELTVVPIILLAVGGIILGIVLVALLLRRLAR